MVVYTFINTEFWCFTTGDHQLHSTSFKADIIPNLQEYLQNKTTTNSYGTLISQKQ